MIVDVSLPISPELLTWPGDPGIDIEPSARIARGDAANVSLLRLGSHTGTHGDPPVHFIEGAAGIDAVPLDVLIGDAFVADARGLMGEVGAAELDGLGVPAGTERLLLKSDNSALWREERPAFPSSYVCLAPDGAEWCVARGLRLVGVDLLSVEAAHAPGHPVHVSLLSAGLAIVEGLDLGMVEPGPWRLAVLPLRVRDGDGAPARAVLQR